MPSEIIFVDNSRISGFKRCPTYFYLRYVQHLTREMDSPALIFGSAWHAGMEAIYRARMEGPLNGDAGTLCTLANNAFNKCWEEGGMSVEVSLEQAEKLKARQPGTAHEMFYHYIDQKYDWLSQIEVLGVEVPFVVPLYKDDKFDVYLSGRIDAIIREPGGGIWVVEHKTTSLYSIKWGFQSKFVNSFSPNAQIDTYAFAAKMMYGKDEMQGVYVDGALVHQKHHDKFKMIPIMKPYNELQTWYNDTKWWIERIMHHKEQNHWPHNSEGCSHQYGFCAFRDLCELVSDPRSITDIPIDYIREPWEPFDEEELKKLIAGGSNETTD